MAVSGRIGNRALLKQAAQALQIEGVEQRVPTDVDRSNVKLVYNVGSLNPGIEDATESWEEYSGGDIMDGVSGGGIDLIGPSTSDPPGLSNLFKYRVENVFAQIVLDAAGAVAAAGNLIRVYMTLGDLRIIHIESAFRVLNGKLNYYWALNGFQDFIGIATTFSVGGSPRPWSGLVPVDDTLTIQCQMYNPAGYALVNFPANSQFTGYINARRSLDGGWPPL